MRNTLSCIIKYLLLLYIVLYNEKYTFMYNKNIFIIYHFVYNKMYNILFSIDKFMNKDNIRKFSLWSREVYLDAEFVYSMDLCDITKIHFDNKINLCIGDILSMIENKIEIKYCGNIVHEIYKKEIMYYIDNMLSLMQNSVKNVLLFLSSFFHSRNGGQKFNEYEELCRLMRINGRYIYDQMIFMYILCNILLRVNFDSRSKVFKNFKGMSRFLELFIYNNEIKDSGTLNVSHYLFIANYKTFINEMELNIEKIYLKEIDVEIFNSHIRNYKQLSYFVKTNNPQKGVFTKLRFI